MVSHEKSPINRSILSSKVWRFRGHGLTVDDSLLTDIYKAVGTIYFEKKQLDLALIYSNRVLDCRMRKKKSWNHPSVAECYQLIGKVYLAKHDLTLGSAYLNKVMQDPAIDLVARK